MASKEEFLMNLKDFGSTIQTTWQKLQKENDFCDVTLACEDKQMKVHKIVLSSFSSIFREILKSNSTQNSVIYLRGVKSKELTNLVNFMYQGQINIASDELNNFLSVAEDLEVKEICFQNENLTDEHPLHTEEMKTDLELKEISSLNENLTDTNPLNIEHIESDHEASEDENLTDKNPLNIEHFQSDHEASEDDIPVNVELIKCEPEVEPSLTPKSEELQGIQGMIQCSKDQCEKQFTTSMGLRLHVNSIHKGIRYSCNECNYKATQKFSLKVHVKSAHNSNKKKKENNLQGQRSFICSSDNCEKQLTTSTGLQMHEETIHNGVNYPCTECSFETTRQMSLKAHINSVHRGIRYPCSHCEKQFTTSLGLQLHTKSTHEGVRYSCEECNYKATRKFSLREHVKSVHKGVRYPCPQCSFQASFKQYINAHIKTNHK